jgi:hypothetical protein
MLFLRNNIDLLLQFFLRSPGIDSCKNTKNQPRPLFELRSQQSGQERANSSRETIPLKMLPSSETLYENKRAVIKKQLSFSHGITVRIIRAVYSIYECKNEIPQNHK